MNYDPLKHKTPYGASVCEQKTKIVFPLDASFGVERVSIILRKGDTTLIFDFHSQMIKGDVKFFECEFVMPESGIWFYRFEAYRGNETFYFGQNQDCTAICGEWLPEWQLTVIEKDFKTPDWAKSGVIYQIFGDRFCKGAIRHFRKKGTLHSDWHEDPVVADDGEEYLADDFFGGNIEGIISKLPYLKSLGVSLIYLNPIFKSCSNHRYDTGDYFQIDELFGDKHQFSKLIAKAKKLDINIMLDGVFNHTGSDSIYFNKKGNYNSIGAYQSKNSPYYDWYTFYTHPNHYHCWWGCTVVPTVNKNIQSYRNMILGANGVIDYWTKKGVKGWRLDVVDELPIDFVSEIRKVLKNISDDNLLIGEVWEDASTKVSYDIWRPYFFGDQLDGVMNYPFKDAILDFVVDKDISYFKGRVSSIMQHYPKQCLDVCMNMLSTHDTVRAITRLSQIDTTGLSKKQKSKLAIKPHDLEQSVKLFKIATVIQYFMPGMPSIYYGDEAGVLGFEDPMNRKTYPWGRENQNLVSFFEKLGKIRTQESNVLQGNANFDDRDDLLILNRENDIEKLKVIINLNDDVKYINLEEKYKDLINQNCSFHNEIRCEANSFLVLKKI